MRRSAHIPAQDVQEHTLLPRPAKQRLEWSALLLFVLGLCSLASPHLMRHAHVHHTGTTGSPASRSSSRSSNRGGADSELDRDRLHRELSGAKRNPVTVTVAQAATSVLPMANLPGIAFARSALPDPADEEATATPALRFSRGRAPPTV